jgi:hypothetical protein
MTRFFKHFFKHMVICGFAVLSLAPAAFGAGTRSAELQLLMVERAGCPWCRRAEAEIAPVYSKTDEGRMAPLRQVDLSAGLPPNIVYKSPVRFTPTFILVNGNHEIGRITGYISEDAFWGQLTELTRNLAPPH